MREENRFKPLDEVKSNLLRRVGIVLYTPIGLVLIFLIALIDFPITFVRKVLFGPYELPEAFALFGEIPNFFKNMTATFKYNRMQRLSIRKANHQRRQARRIS